MHATVRQRVWLRGDWDVNTALLAEKDEEGEQEEHDRVTE